MEECYRAGHRLEYTVVGTRGSAFVDIWHQNIRICHSYQGEKFYPRVARYEEYRDLPTYKLFHNVQDETADIVNRVAAGRKEFIAPDDAYLSTLACLASDMSMERDGLPITLQEVEAKG
jgi:hypothetical protein